MIIELEMYEALQLKSLIEHYMQLLKKCHGENIDSCRYARIGLNVKKQIQDAQAWNKRHE